MPAAMVTLLRLVRSINAAFPMQVTGRSLILSGMATAPPLPVYLVMVMAPLLVATVNCAHTATGIAKSKSPAAIKAERIGPMKLQFEPAEGCCFI